MAKTSATKVSLLSLQVHCLITGSPCSCRWPSLSLFLHCSLFCVTCLVTVNINKCHQIDTSRLWRKNKKKRRRNPEMCSLLRNDSSTMGHFFVIMKMRTRVDKRDQVPKEGSCSAVVQYTKCSFGFPARIALGKGGQPAGRGIKIPWSPQILPLKIGSSNFKGDVYASPGASSKMSHWVS